MQRDVRRLADTHFDVVIVGAGVYGAIAAWDAALRGLSVALIDKGDFGSGTSFNNLKTLHGGLRSLQALDFKQMRLFIRERRALARIAPHLVRPLAFVVPTYRDPRRSAILMRFALAINEAVSSDRHHGLADPALTLPTGRVVSREECLQFNPLIDPEAVTGGAMWHDYQLESTDRMTFSFVLSAVKAGAVAANYVEATDLLRGATKIEGLRVRDSLSGDAFDLHADIVLNAAGPWASSLLARLDDAARSPAPLLSRAMNLVTRRVTGSHACGGLARGRFLFVVPWRDVSVVGTSHDAHQGSADALTVTPADLDAFLADANAAFPRAQLTTRDVRLVHRGLLPMVAGDGDHVRLLRESTVVDHRQHNAPGLISMFGVRYTTARETAERAVDAVFRARSIQQPPPGRTSETPVVGGDISDKTAFLRSILASTSSLSAESLRRIATTYGTDYVDVAQLPRDDATLAAALGKHCDVTGAEIVYAVRKEAAVTLRDALIRRTEAGSSGFPGDDAVATAGDLMARELQWDPTRVAKEIASVKAFYALPTT